MSSLAASPVASEIVPGPLILVSAAGTRRFWRGRGRELLLYLARATSVLTLTAPKIGSEFNSQLETTVLLILSACMALHVRVRGRIEVEPLIYWILAAAGRIDHGPLRRDLASRAFLTVILLQDLNRPLQANPEIATPSPNHRAQTQRHYRLVTHIPGPYLDGYLRV